MAVSNTASMCSLHWWPPSAGAAGPRPGFYGLGAVHQWFVACFPKEAQEEFWADPGAIAAGSYAPVGKTVAADGGYRTSGVWSFASGCDNAQWYLLSTMVPPVGASEAAKPSFLLVPRENARIDDNWHTMGLAGTGSKNIIADDLFVLLIASWRLQT
jgi:resorcinol 4-hydroxylase (FADH2)